MSSYDGLRDPNQPQFNAALDARYIALPAGMILTTMGEVMQTEMQQYRADGIAPPDLSGFPGAMFEAMANCPLDNKALGLAAFTVGAAGFVSAGRRIREIAFDNVQIASGIEVEKPTVLQRTEKFIGRAATTALAAGTAYKVGEQLTPIQDMFAGLSVTGAGLAYLMNIRRRVFGRI